MNEFVCRICGSKEPPKVFSTPTYYQQVGKWYDAIECKSCGSEALHLAKEQPLYVKQKSELEIAQERISELEAAIMKISEITKRNGCLSEMEKNLLDLDAAIKEAEKLVGT